MADRFILEINYAPSVLKMSLVKREEHLPSLKIVNQIPFDFEYIKKLCAQIDNCLDQQNTNCYLKKEDIRELKKLGSLLFNYLLSKKIKQRLKEESLKDLTLSVDEQLIFIPWELLYTGEDFLCLKFNLGRSINMNKEIDIEDRRHLRFPLKVLIVANPTGDLLSSYQEGLKIKNFLLRYQDLEVDFKSSEVDTLYLKKNLSEYDLFHFAGHYEFDSVQPSESGLVFKDGRLKPYDFAMLFQDQRFPYLVFLNACQSTRAECNPHNFQNWQYLYSLAQTFLLGGSQHYVGCFWKVQDDTAVEFACDFYEQILKGYSIGFALRQARINFIEKHGIEAIAWANYLLYGDPGYIFAKPSFSKRTFLGKEIFLKQKKLLTGSFFLLAAIFLIFFIFIYFNPGVQLIYQQAYRDFYNGKNENVFLSLDKVIKNKPDYLMAYCLYADTYFRLGKLSEALRYYFDYLRYAQKKKDYKNICSAYLKIGWTYYMRAEYANAMEFYLKARELSCKTKDKLNEADALSKMAVYYTDKKNFQKALSLLVQSSEINLERKNNNKHLFNLACDYFNLGLVFSEMKDYLKAKEFYDKSKTIFLKLKEIRELSDYYFNIGEIARFEKRYQDALDYYEKGLILDKKLSHLFNLSSDYQMLAELYWEMGDLEKAEEYFVKALTVCQQIENPAVSAELHYELGAFYKERKDFFKAKDYFKKAISLYQKIDPSIVPQIEKDLLSLE